MTISPNILGQIAMFYEAIADADAKRLQLNSMALVEEIRAPNEIQLFTFIANKTESSWVFWTNQYEYQLDIEIIEQEPLTISLTTTVNKGFPTSKPILPNNVIIMLSKNIFECRLDDIKNILEIPNILRKIRSFDISNTGECLLYYTTSG